jgi:hypothetical protein
MLAIPLACNFAWAGQTVLLSIKGPSLQEGQYVDKFEIDTWDVDILAVCKIPNHWIITAGDAYDLGGTLSGQSQGGTANLREFDLNRLNDLFLIVINEYQKFPRGNPNTDYFPATFSGSVEIGTFAYNGDKMQQVPLKPEDFLWAPAQKCPAPAGSLLQY